MNSRTSTEKPERLLIISLLEPSQIKDLNLDNARSANIVGLTDEYKNLEVLSLINVGLANLKGFPNLPKLKRLELSDNRISGGLNFLSGCPSLKTLNLCGNKIADFDALEPLVSHSLLLVGLCAAMFTDVHTLIRSSSHPHDHRKTSNA